MVSEESDDDFEVLSKNRGDTKGKGKGKANAMLKTMKTDSFSLDSLLAQSEMDIERREKISVGLDMSAVEHIVNREFDIERDKQQLYAENARAELQEAQMLANESITIPGAIKVFEPKVAKSTTIPFEATCPSTDVSVLFEALRRSEDDPDDLEEILRGALVPWVRQKLGGRAPPSVCRWIMRLVACHNSPRLVLAAEEALLLLLNESNNEWKFGYDDSFAVWQACGAVWLSSGQIDEKVESDESGGLSAHCTGDQAAKSGSHARGELDMHEDGVDEEDVDNDYDEEDEEDGDEGTAVRRNLGSFLNIVEACLRQGAHVMSDAELQEMLLDLLSAALDKGVCGSCQTEVYRTIQAVVDAMPRDFYERQGGCSVLVDRICDPAARRLESRMEKLSVVLLARNVPLRRGTVGSDRSDKGTSLRHEVSHRLLSKWFLKRTTYAAEEVQKADIFSRSLKAMKAVLNDEDDILEDDSHGGYERQFGVVALVNEMCAGALAVSATGRPEPGYCREMLAMLSAMDRHLKDVMQRPVQMSKTLIDLMKTKLTPFAKERARQGNLSGFVESVAEGADWKSGGDDSGDGDRLETKDGEGGDSSDDIGYDEGLPRLSLEGIPPTPQHVPMECP